MLDVVQVLWRNFVCGPTRASAMIRFGLAANASVTKLFFTGTRLMNLMRGCFCTFTPASVLQSAQASARVFYEAAETGGGVHSPNQLKFIMHATVVEGIWYAVA